MQARPAFPSSTRSPGSCCATPGGCNHTRVSHPPMARRGSAPHCPASETTADAPQSPHQPAQRRVAENRQQLSLKFIGLDHRHGDEILAHIRSRPSLILRRRGAPVRGSCEPAPDAVCEIRGLATSTGPSIWSMLSLQFRGCPASARDSSMQAGRDTPDATQLLVGLVGKTIPTLTGKSNRVIRLSGAFVIVGTGKSPHGQRVRISDVQSALDRLYAAGELEISKESVGYRSAFIGAVIRQLRGVQVATNPRRAWLA